MSIHKATKIFVIGGTGAQGLPVIQSLVADKSYQVLALTRDVKSPRALSLLALGNVELLSGSLANEDTLRAGFRACDGAFVNIDGFNTGEKNELYWAIRAYEIALQEGVKFYVYGNLDYVSKKGGYDPKYRAGHYDGKGRVGEWILFQNRENKDKMGAALFTTGPYIDMAISSKTIMTPTVEDGAVTWRVPIGEGHVSFVALADCGYYVRWLFDHPEKSNGLDLEVGIGDITFNDMVEGFEKVTGRKARWVDVSLDEYWKEGMEGNGDRPAGYNADIGDKSTMSLRDNFTGFWNIWKYKLLHRDYKFLDEVHPNRIKTAEQWFRMEDERGRKEGLGALWDRLQTENQKPILKVVEDGWKGIL